MLVLENLAVKGGLSGFSRWAAETSPLSRVSRAFTVRAGVVAKKSGIGD